MNIQPSFQRSHITRRQLVRHEPKLEKTLEKLQGDTVDVLTNHLDSRIKEYASGQLVCTGWASAFGAAGLIAGTLNYPWLGMGLGVTGGIIAYNAFSNNRSKNQAQGALDRINSAAEKTEQALLQAGPDGTVVDRRFYDERRYHDPQEVRQGDQVLSRSVNVVVGNHLHSETVSIRADVAAGTVTLSGSQGEGTFPGTLELPTFTNQKVRVTRTDEKPLGYDQAELEFTRHWDQKLSLTKPNALLTPGRGVGDGLVLMFDGQGRSAAVKTVMPSGFLANSWNEKDAHTVTFEAGQGVKVHKRLNLPEMTPLQVVDLKDRMPVVGATFELYRKKIDIGYDAAQGLLSLSNGTSQWQVPGKLTDEGKLIMQQGEARVAQSFEANEVHLKVRQGGEDATIDHACNGAPIARVFEEKVPCELQDDGSYRLEMPFGVISVKPAVSLKQLTEG